MKYNYNRLKGLIREHCGTQANFAGELGISTSTLITRLNSSTKFTQDEIKQACKILKIDSPEEMDKVFFTLKY